MNPKSRRLVLFGASHCKKHSADDLVIAPDCLTESRLAFSFQYIKRKLINPVAVPGRVDHQFRANGPV